MIDKVVMREIKLGQSELERLGLIGDNSLRYASSVVHLAK